jgi:hypothetical protein
MSDTQKQLTDALRVLVLAHGTRRWLEEHDPKALEQALAALEAVDGPTRIRTGDRVEIESAGATTRGTVLTASNQSVLGAKPNWYIELTIDHGGGYGYWKQKIDGGTVKVLAEDS